MDQSGYKYHEYRQFPSARKFKGLCFFTSSKQSTFYILTQQKEQKQIKFFFFALVIKKDILTTVTYTYVCQYWPDIINLLNEWTNYSRKRLKIKQQKHNYIQCQKSPHQNCQNYSQLENNLKDDSSIAAFEITCYLKSCCDLFEIQISTSKGE